MDTNVCARNALVAALATVVISGASQAQTVVGDTAIKISWGAFVDGYYAWDFQRPANFDRAFAGGTPFTTQPARHNEFNVNLAYIEAKLDGERLRGRLALQGGTSVQSNYAGEPANGVISGPTLSRFIQEAVVGIKVARNLWVDGGIFFSHMGMEGWVSRDNPTYTRSLVAEYSPYYQSGVKLTWAANNKLTVQFDVVNGWQNISENNNGKGVGARVDYALSPSSSVSYYNLISQEAGTRLRVFNGVGSKLVHGSTTLLAQFDFGAQDNSNASGSTAVWYGAIGSVRQQLSRTTAISARVERYADKDQVIVSTGAVGGVNNPALRANGASVGADWSPQARVVWRTELRGFLNDQPIFPNGRSAARSKRDVLAVSSLAVTF